MENSVWFSGDDGTLYVLQSNGIAVRVSYPPDLLAPSGLTPMVYSARSDSWSPLPYQKD